MPTIIDSLILELALDPSKMTKGQQAALSQLRSFEGQFLKSGKNVESSAASAAQSLSKLRTEVLSFGSLLLGGVGVTKFVQDLTNTAQTLGFTTKLTGNTVEALSAFRNAARLGGGSAEGMTGFMVGLNAELNSFALTGQSSVLPYLRALGINIYDAGGKIKDSATLVDDLVNAIDRGTADPGRAAAFLRGVGADPATINVILQGAKAWEEYKRKARDAGGATRENAEDARVAKEAWAELTITVENFGYKVLASAYRAWKALRGVAVEGGGPVGATNLGGGTMNDFIQAELAKASAKNAAAAGGGGGLPAGIAAALAGSRVTSTTGGQHAGTAHQAGLAVDFVPPPGANYAEMAARLSRDLGIKVINEERNTTGSKYWTGPHLHAEFPTPAASARFAQQVSGGGLGAAGGGSVSTDNSRRETSVGTIVVNVPSGDPNAIAAGIAGALRQQDLTAQSNRGPGK